MTTANITANTNVKEKVAYLHGLTRGLNLDDRSAEGKVLLSVVEVLDTFANEIQNLRVAQQDLETYVETMDEDLNDVEEMVFDTDRDDESSGVIEVECPKCRETVSFSGDLADDDTVEVTCPNCGEVVYESSPYEGAALNNARQTGHPGI